MIRLSTQQQLTDLKRWMTQVDNRSAESAEAINQLQARVDNLPVTVAVTVATPWRAMQEDHRRREAVNLARWVTWLVNAYDLSERWPACWLQHEGLVEILRALRRWHAALTTELAADPRAVTGWHDALFRTVDRNMIPVTQRCLTSHRKGAVFDSPADESATLPGDPPAPPAQNVSNQ